MINSRCLDCGATGFGGVLTHATSCPSVLSVPSMEPQAVNDTGRASMPSSDQVDALDKLIEAILPYRYPNYNLGLLPDEEGYDAVQDRDHYLTDEARAEAKAKLSALLVEARIDELNRAENSNGSGLGWYYHDRIKELEKQREADNGN